MSHDHSPSSINSSVFLSSAINPSLGRVGGSGHRARGYKRYSPYPNPRRSLHQLSITYLDPTYVEDLVDIVMPRPPRHVLEAALEPPLRNWGNNPVEENAVVAQGPVRQVFAWFARFIGFLEQTILGAI